jgi:hypothetical protein
VLAGKLQGGLEARLELLDSGREGNTEIKGCTTDEPGAWAVICLQRGAHGGS